MSMLKSQNLNYGGPMESVLLTFMTLWSKSSTHQTKQSTSAQSHTVSEASNLTPQIILSLSLSTDIQFMPRAQTMFPWTCSTQDSPIKTTSHLTPMNNSFKMPLIHISTWSDSGVEDSINLKSSWSWPPEKVSWSFMTSCSVTAFTHQPKPSLSTSKKKSSNKSEEPEITLVSHFGLETTKFSKESTTGDGAKKDTKMITRDCLKP